MRSLIFFFFVAFFFSLVRRTVLTMLPQGRLSSLGTSLSFKKNKKTVSLFFYISVALSLRLIGQPSASHAGHFVFSGEPKSHLMTLVVLFEWHFFLSQLQQFTLVYFSSHVSRCRIKRAHTFLMLSLLYKFLLSVILLIFTELVTSAFVIFLSFWISSVLLHFHCYTEDGLPDFGSSAAFERLYLNCLHHICTGSYQGQNSYTRIFL